MLWGEVHHWLVVSMPQMCQLCVMYGQAPTDSCLFTVWSIDVRSLDSFQGKDKGRAPLAVRALCPDATVIAFENVAADGKAKACGACLSPVALNAVEALENALQILRRNKRSPVLDPQKDLPIVVAVRDVHCAALVRIAGGVFYEIAEDLA